MRYFVGFLITIGLIIILIIMLFGGGGSRVEQEVSKEAKSLGSYASTTAEVSMLIDGPVNAASEHQQVRVTVGRTAVVFEKFTGYNGQVVDLKSFENTEAAYSNFLLALESAGFTKGNKNRELADERKYCPLGSRYVFSIDEGATTIQRFWTTTCNDTQTYLGDTTTTVTLFKAQVPGYGQLTQDFITN